MKIEAAEQPQEPVTALSRIASSASFQNYSFSFPGNAWSVASGVEV